MRKVKVSVIVPVYNVESYIERCLQSLASQTLKELEIIVVNDGSPDNSQLIIDKYVKKYKNIKSYIKANGGLSDARNYGIDKATGDYIAFLDSDDYVLEDTYLKMYEKAVSDDFDMVVCDLNYVYPNKITRAYSNIKNDTTDIKKAMINIYPAAWNKLYRKDLFDNGIHFKKGVWYEDVEFIYRLLPYVHRIGVVHEPFIQYVQRDGAITSTISKKLYDYIDNFNGIVDFYKQNNFYNDYHSEIEYAYSRYLLATFLKQASKYDYDNYIKAYEKAMENVKNNFPNYKKNKYLRKSIKGIYIMILNKTIAKLMYKLYNIVK